ncbi:cyclohexanone monooxygenase, partial [Streptomyces yangpuensis]
ERTVWNTGGCTSWYLDANGRNTTVWPGTTGEFRRETRSVDLGEYEVVRVRERVPVAVAAAPAAAPSPAAPPPEARTADAGGAGLEAAGADAAEGVA